MISPRMLLPGLLQKAQAQWNRGDIGFLRPSDVCRVPLGLTADPGAGRAKSSTQRLRAKGVKGAEVTSVNMALPVQRRGLCAMLAFIFAACTIARL